MVDPRQKKMLTEIMEADAKDGLYDNNKLTAVEWLMDNLKLIDKNAYNELYEQYEQAKAMEKEQHSKTFNQGVQWMQYHRDLVNGGTEYWDKEPSYFLEYYNETYNK